VSAVCIDIVVTQNMSVCGVYTLSLKCINRKLLKLVKTFFWQKGKTHTKLFMAHAIYGMYVVYLMALYQLIRLYSV
jgi:hypothetical protein